MWTLICILSLDQQSWQVPVGDAPDGGAAAAVEHSAWWSRESPTRMKARGLFFSKLLNSNSYFFFFFFLARLTPVLLQSIFTPASADDLVRLTIEPTVV